MTINEIIEKWKGELPEFKAKTEQFLAGELPKGDYKGFSGRFGSYAQKDMKHFMLRLRTPGGRVTKEQMDFVTDMIKEYHFTRTHFTTCQTLQLHDLDKEQLFGIMDAALERGIIIMGGGGDYPRNVMCSPLSGVEVGEFFDVMDYARAAGLYLLTYIDAPKMPRKLKVCFSNSKKNIPHATFRDLGFAAREDGTFDVYSAGGLGNNPKLGIKVAKEVDPLDVLYYVRAMWMLFRQYGNYENRGRARTRYMQETLGSEQAYVDAFNEKLAEVRAEGEDLRAVMEDYVNQIKLPAIEKKAAGDALVHPRAIPQKQEGLYAVSYHPMGGIPSMETMRKLEETICNLEGVELRIAPDESEYIINLTADEARAVIAATDEDHASTLFENSVSCIGALTCQQGVRDSQGLLDDCIKVVREAGIKDGALPKIHISGCPSSCAAHQMAALGFRGGVKKTDAGVVPGFVLFAGGCDKQGEEKMGEEIGAFAIEEIPAFLVKLGTTVEASGMDYDQWISKNPEGLRALIG